MEVQSSPALMRNQQLMLQTGRDSAGRQGCLTIHGAAEPERIRTGFQAGFSQSWLKTGHYSFIKRLLQGIVISRKAAYSTVESEVSL